MRKRPPAHRSLFSSLLMLPAVVALASCEALFGGYSQDNPESCARNAELCVAPDEICNQTTRRCEPAVRLDGVSPTSVPNTSAVEIKVTGRNFAPGMQVLFGGEPQAGAIVDSAEQIRIPLAARPDRKGPLGIELVHPGGQRVGRDHAVLFYGPIDFSLGSRTGLSGLKQTLAGDFDRDGKVDILMTNRTSTAQVLLGNGDGTFRDGVTVRFSSAPLITILADVDRDGDLDVIASATLRKTDVMLNNGDGSFAAVLTDPAAINGYGLRAIDVTGDQILDLLSLENRALAIRQGNGDGTFQPKREMEIAGVDFGISSSIVPADLDGDGKLDLVVGHSTDPQILILPGEGNGTFRVLDPMVVDAPVTQVDAVDLDFDGKHDLVVRHTAVAGKVSVLRGSGNFSFMAVDKPTVPSGSTAGLVRDFNGDRAPDLVIFNIYQLEDNLMVFTGTGDGHFLAGPKYTLPPTVSEGCAGDWDGDGRLDLALVTSGNLMQLARNISP